MQFISERSKGPGSLIAFFLLLFLLLTSGVPTNAADGALKNETARNISNDDLSGEDMQIRQVAVEALGTAAGTVVVMNARTGRIYTIVNQDWAIREAFKPCSTIKLVTGVAGVRENLIGPNGSLLNRSYRLGLDEALAYSNNTYFQRVGADLGSEKMVSYARALGLGEPTGINAEGESAGTLPDGNENLRIYSHADDFAVTPLQLAVMVSAVTNGGKLIVPQIARTRNQKANFRGFLRRELDLEPAAFERVIPGMMGAVDYGTARVIDNSLHVGGKTGSCISAGTWVGLFASVAPINDPRFAVVVITRGPSARGRHSAAIAGKIYEALKPRFGQKGDNTLLALKTDDREDPNPARGTSAETIIVGARADRDAGRTEERRPSVRKTGASNPTGTPAAAEASKKDPPKSMEELFPTIVIVKGKPEITRPRVVNE